MNHQQKLGTVPPVWVYSLISSVRGFFKKLYYKSTPASMAMFEKVRVLWIAKAIGVACELNLAEIIGRQKMAVDELAEKSNTDPAALYRLMRLLASEGIFRETGNRVFQNNTFSDALTEGPGNLKNLIMHQVSQSNWQLVNELKTSVISGKNSAQKLFGSDVFTHLQNHPEKNEMYNKAMSETSLLASESIASAYAFTGIGTLADIGGGEGMLLCTILQKNKSVKGILFDLPHVVQTAGKLISNFGLEERVQIVPGRFFENSLPTANAYILKNILHAFDDDYCIRLLELVGKSMIGKGKILLIESVIKNDNKEAFGKILDLQMLVGTENGRERTEAEFGQLFEAAGFRLNRIIKTISPFCVIEGIKN